MHNNVELEAVTLSPLATATAIIRSPEFKELVNIAYTAIQSRPEYLCLYFGLLGPTCVHSEATSVLLESLYEILCILL